MIRWEFKFTITEFHLIFALIFTFHLGLMGLKSQHSEIISVLKEEHQKKIKVKLKPKEDVSEEELLNAMAGMELRRKPYVVTYLGNLKLKKHSELLSLLQSRVNLKSKIVSSTKGIGILKSGEVAIESNKDINFEITEEQKKNLIKRFIKERMAGVDVCKRRYLLEDEFLMGTIKVNMKIHSHQNLAVPRFSGHGNRKVIQSLENCVQGHLVSMKFPYELSNAEVTFDVRVN